MNGQWTGAWRLKAAMVGVSCPKSPGPSPLALGQASWHVCCLPSTPLCPVGKSHGVWSPRLEETFLSAHRGSPCDTGLNREFNKRVNTCGICHAGDTSVTAYSKSRLDGLCPEQRPDEGERVWASKGGRLGGEHMGVSGVRAVCAGPSWGHPSDLLTITPPGRGSTAAPAPQTFPGLRGAGSQRSSGMASSCTCLQLTHLPPAQSGLF